MSKKKKKKGNRNKKSAPKNPPVVKPVDNRSPQPVKNNSANKKTAAPVAPAKAPNTPAPAKKPAAPAPAKAPKNKDKKKSRALPIILIIVCVLVLAAVIVGLVFALRSCNTKPDDDDDVTTTTTAKPDDKDPKPAHEHSFSTEWTSDETNHWHVCSGCDEVDALAAHTFGAWVVTVEPTEESEGSRSRACSVCGYTVTEKVAKLDHTHTFGTEWLTDADNHWHVCSGCDEIDSLGAHTYGDWVVTIEATEESEGSRYHTCTVCGYTATETLEKLPHTHKFSSKWTYDDTNHWHVCSGCDVVSGLAAHSQDKWSVIKEATEEDPVGIIGRVCKCGYVIESKTYDYVPPVSGVIFYWDDAFSGTEAYVKGLDGFEGDELVIPAVIKATNTEGKEQLKVVTAIGDRAFYGTSLKKVTLPESIAEIGDSAFAASKSLSSFTVPSSVINIGEGAFSGSYVTELIISEGVVSIGEKAFYNCGSLTSVVIPATLTSIGDRAFADCVSLESITVDEDNEVFYSENNCVIEKESGKLILGCKTSTIPEGVTAIGDYAFYNCTGLENVVIPEGVTEIGKSAFSGCMDLVSISFPSTVTTVNGADFIKTPVSSITVAEGNETYACENNCVYEIETGKLVLGRGAAIPDEVKSIGEYAFAYCGTIGNVIIPDGVTEICDYAFYSCQTLAKVTLPDSLTAIGAHAFENCKYLSQINVGESVTVGTDAFKGCNKLGE